MHSAPGTPPIIRPARLEDRAEWLRLRSSLWPHSTATELEQEIAGYDARGEVAGLPTAVFVADRGDARGLGGFVEASLRPFADGCASSPVGYIEGWFVDPDLRRGGVGRALVRAAEDWARAHGCREMASDCHTGNHVSYHAHVALGYRPTRRFIQFAKPLADPPPAAPAQRDWVALTPLDLPTQTAVDLVTDPAAGGIDVFLGTTRAETDPAGRALVALDYEAYAEMALQQMRDLAGRVRARWPILRLAVLHRVGRVPVGQPSVLIAVAAPHRAEAFEACRWLIDTLKAEAAIWKKEVWSDGSATWVHPSAVDPLSPSRP